MAGIQFFGIDDVVEAYSDYEVDCWAIFEGKDLIRAGCDDERLRAYLTKLQTQGSAATYTLRVYRAVDDADSITPKTEYSACFKFKLNEGGRSVSGTGAVTRYGGVDPITAKVQSVIADEVGKVIDKKLGRGDDDDDDRQETLQDVVMGVLKQPDKLIGILGALKGLFAPADAVGQPAVAYAGVSGPVQPRRAGAVRPHLQQQQTDVSEETEETDTEETMERVAAVLDRLEKADPKILANLEKLADIAEKKPAIYKMAIAQLNDL